MTPGEYLRAELKRRGLNQKTAAERLGISRQLINNVIAGRQSISRAMARKLATLTGKRPDYWLRDSFPDRPQRPATRQPSRPPKGPSAKPLTFKSFVKGKPLPDETDATKRIVAASQSPEVTIWGELRSYLKRQGASDSDFVSARALWREYTEAAKNAHRAAPDNETKARRK